MIVWCNKQKHLNKWKIKWGNEWIDTWKYIIIIIMSDFLPISFQTQILLKLRITQNKRALFGTFEQRYWRTSLKKKKKERKKRLHLIIQLPTRVSTPTSGTSCLDVAPLQLSRFMNECVQWCSIQPSNYIQCRPIWPLANSLPLLQDKYKIQS